MWAWLSDEPLKRLDRPPIVEVICGVIFPSLDVDPVVVGGFWLERQRKYPTRQFLDPIEPRQLHLAMAPDPAQLTVDVPSGRVRTWLVSANGERILQLQHDRFYLNWRAVGSEYPRFSGDGGLLREALVAYGEFADYCQRVIGTRPAPAQIELGKVDVLQEGVAWSNATELRALMPRLGPWLELAAGESPSCGVRLNDRRGDDELRLAIDTTVFFRVDGPPMRGVKIETTVRVPTAEATMQADFQRADGVANSLFAALVPSEQRRAHFGEAG
jgi:hypothetical protein